MVPLRHTGPLITLRDLLQDIPPVVHGFLHALDASKHVTQVTDGGATSKVDMVVSNGEP
jgi:hypothetical protein